MRLVKFLASGGARLGYTDGNSVVDVNAYLRRDLVRRGYEAQTAARMANQETPTDIGDVLAGGKATADKTQALLATIASLSKDEHAALASEQIITPADAVHYLAPFAANATLFAIGKNYAEHVAEGGGEIPTTPSLFMRTHNSVVGHRQAVMRPKLSDQFDWEVELAVVIGRHCRYASNANALDFVGGYAVLNEGSLRDYQKAAPYPTAGKNFYMSGSFGPSIVTADEVPDPQDMPMRSWVNGELMQNANTSQMIYDIRFLIAYISEFTPLRPGDVITTGTPAGVGLRRKPPRWLKPSDTLRMQIGNLDVLENTVVDEVPRA